MSADSEASRRLRQAYEEAWAARPESGNSDEVLRARLHAHQLSEDLDATTLIHGFMFDIWRRDVPPERVGREVWKATGGVALQLLSTGRSLLQTFRTAGNEEEAMDQQADLEEMPEDKEGVLDNHDHPASASLTFEPVGDAAARVVAHYAALTRRRSTWHHPSVWFDMQPDQPRASVRLGSTVIGEAAVPAEIWRAMCELAREDLYADGFLMEVV